MRFPDMPASTLPQLQRDVLTLFYQLGPLAAGRLITEQTIGTTDTHIAHGLGAVPQAVFVMPRADARVWRVSVGQALVTLRASAAVVCDLLVVP